MLLILSTCLERDCVDEIKEVGEIGEGGGQKAVRRLDDEIFIFKAVDTLSQQ